MIERVKQGETSRAEQRALAANTVEVTIDAQGRISIDRELRDFAGLETDSKVIVAGSFDRVELWNPSTYEGQMTEGGALIRGAR